MRLLTMLALIIVLTFINLGDVLLPSSLGRLSRKTRDTLTKFTLDLTLPQPKLESTQGVSETPKKSLTDEYFDHALEAAEKQVGAVEDNSEE